MSSGPLWGGEGHISRGGDYIMYARTHVSDRCQIDYLSLHRLHENVEKILAQGTLILNGNIGGAFKTYYKLNNP